MQTVGLMKFVHMVDAENSLDDAAAARADTDHTDTDFIILKHMKYPPL